MNEQGQHAGLSTFDRLASMDTDSALREMLYHARRRRQIERPSLSAPIRVVVFFVLLAAGMLAAFLAWNIILSPLLAIAGLVAGGIVVRMIHVLPQWERGLVLRLGSLQAVRGPGLVLIFPVIDYLKPVDTRVLTIDIPRQLVITRDNVPVAVNGVLYFNVSDVNIAIVKVQDYEYAVAQFAMSALRDVIGGLSLDDLLSERDQIQKNIEHAIAETAEKWGLHVESLRLKDIDMPEELKRMMSRQASAEREKRATITKAEGDKLAAFNLAEAASTMLLSPGAMQLRTLQTLDSLGASPSNTVVLAVPTDLFAMAQKLASNAVPISVPPAAPPPPAS